MSSVAIGRRFEAGRVINGLFAAFAANLGPFLLIGAVCAGLPALASGWLTGAAAPTALTNPANFMGLTIASSAIGVVGGLLVQVLIVPATVAHLDGEKADFARYARLGVTHLWPLVLIDVIMGIGIFFGTLLLIVPGMIVLTWWSVAAPVRIIENLGPVQSLSRSAKLTEGRRWPVFGLLLLFGVAVIVIQLVVVGLVTQFKLGLVEETQSAAFQLAAAPILATLFGPLGAAAGAALYYELRGGSAAQTVAKIFD